LGEEAERLCRAKRYERTDERKDTRAGYYTRKLHTKAGEVDIKMPKLRALPFETGINRAVPAKRPLWKRRWWKCLWQEFRCEEWRTSRKLYGEAK
jgi:hypothetical protein